MAISLRRQQASCRSELVRFLPVLESHTRVANPPVATNVSAVLSNLFISPSCWRSEFSPLHSILIKRLRTTDDRADSSRPKRQPQCLLELQSCQGTFNVSLHMRRFNNVRDDRSFLTQAGLAGNSEFRLGLRSCSGRPDSTVRTKTPLSCCILATPSHWLARS